MRVLYMLPRSSAKHLSYSELLILSLSYSEYENPNCPQPPPWPVSKFRLGPTQISFRYFGEIHPNFAKLLGRNDLCKAPSQQQNFFESFERRNLENTERKRLKEPYTHQHMQQQ